MRGTALFVLLAGCAAEGPYAPGFEASLTHREGCADAVLRAQAPDGTTLRFAVQGVVATAHRVGEPVAATYDLGAAGLVSLGWTDGACADPLGGDAWGAVAGLAELVVTPHPVHDDGAKTATAEVVLSAVQLEGPEGGAARVGEFTLVGEVGVAR